MATFTGLYADWGAAHDNAPTMNEQMVAFANVGGGDIVLPAAAAGYGIASDLLVPAGVTIVGSGTGMQTGLATTPPYGTVSSGGATFTTTSPVVSLPTLPTNMALLDQAWGGVFR